MSVRDLKRFFDEHRQRGQDLALATVYETEGATYSKAGAQMLINGEGDYQGMLSGGCLEGDLAERARAVLASGDTQRVTYDLREDDDTLWGLGVGCEGLMRILLQPLRAGLDYQPFVAMLDVLAGEKVGIAVTVIESDHSQAPAGAALTGPASPLTEFAIAADVAAAAQSIGTGALSSLRSSLQTVHVGASSVLILTAVLRPPPKVLVLGGGLDAEPVVRLCADLGWRVTVQDHRPAYIESGDFSGAQKVFCLPVEALQPSLSLAAYDAVVVMSHHLLTDLAYLRQLASTDVAYIGLLGPKNRRRRLLDELGDVSGVFDDRLHGPAGLDIGGRGPGSIALSIVAQMHKFLAQERGEN